MKIAIALLLAFFPVLVWALLLAADVNRDARDIIPFCICLLLVPFALLLKQVSEEEKISNKYVWSWAGVGFALFILVATSSNMKESTKQSQEAIDALQKTAR